MKQCFFIAINVFTALTVNIYAEGATCNHCQVIREYNKTHHENFEYYDTYLESMGVDREGNDHNSAALNTPSKDGQSTTQQPKEKSSKVAER